MGDINYQLIMRTDI